MRRLLALAFIVTIGIVAALSTGSGQAAQSRQAPAGTAKLEQLTPREEEVLNLLAKGCVSKEIARQLSVSVETVNTHLKHIYEKLHVRSRTEAVIKYMQ